MNDKQTATKQIGNILSFLPEKNGLLQPITYTYTQKKFRQKLSLLPETL